MKNWSNDDVRDFVRHRGYPAKVDELLREHNVTGRVLLALVKNRQLLSSLGLHPLLAMKLRNEIKAYKSSSCTLVIQFCFVTSTMFCVLCLFATIMLN